MEIVPTGIGICINGTCCVVGWPWVAMGVILVMIIALCFVRPR